jgi:flagellar hook-length control protein FliK
MIEAVLNNAFQVSKNDFSPAQTKKPNFNSGKSFSDRMQEINQQKKRSQKNNKSSSVIKEQTSRLDDQEFLEKLKEILAKKNKDVPSELLSLLQGGSLSKEQEAMLAKLMLNLKNSNLDISELKSLLEKNRDNLSAEDSKLQQLLAENQENENSKLQSLNADNLEKIAAMLAGGELQLTEKDNLKLKNEIDQLAQAISNFESDNKKSENSLEQILEAEKLDNKLAELISALKESDFKAQDLAALTEAEKGKNPLLGKLLSSDNADFAEFSQNLNPENANSLFAELAAQMKEMLEQENAKMNTQAAETKVDIGNSDLFSLNSDSTLDFALAGVELETKNQNNFFDLDNSNLFFNLDQSTANNLNPENFSLNSNNTANLAENADLRAQVVEQFRGEYSPETKEIQIQLKPESLGKIDISLAYDNEQLTGKMLVESEVVRAQLENSLKGLKSDLLKQGINIEQFKIETAKTAPQQVEKQNEFAFNDQNSAFSDGETGQNQESEQRQFFQGQYYVQRNNSSSGLDGENIIMRQQEMINRAAFSNEKINLLA